MPDSVPTKTNPFLFWITLWQLLCNPSTVRRYLDVPLSVSIRRSQWFTAWATVIVGIGTLARHPFAASSLTASILHRQANAMHPYAIVLDGFWLIACGVCGYGFLRLYTLVNHVLTLNIFKTRGQRLRLLNVETTLMTLVVPATLAWLLAPASPALGWAIVCLSTLYGFLLLAYGYNLIFHKRRLAGAGLLVASCIVTWFVLAIGALAIAVALAVISFLVIALLRPFMHH